MPREPLYPHIPGSKQPLFPHVPKGQLLLPVTPEVTVGLVDIGKLRAIDLPNVKIAGSYGIGKAKAGSDADVLIGLTDAEWARVTPREPPDVLNKILDVLPEDRLDVKLYKLSNPKELWYYQRGRVIEGKGISGVFMPVTEKRLAQGLWDTAKPVVAIPKAPVTPEVTREAWQMTRAEFIERGITRTSLSPEMEHRGEVFAALRDGKPVPDEVVKDYPDMPRPRLAIPKAEVGMPEPGLQQDMARFKTFDEYIAHYSKDYADWHTSDARAKALNEKFGVKFFESFRMGVAGAVGISPSGQVQLERIWNALKAAIPKAEAGDFITQDTIDYLAKTEGEPIRKFCCRLCGECAPPELLEEGRFPDRIAWLRHHYASKHPSMWGKTGRGSF